jgi:hypothetical protein
MPAPNPHSPAPGPRPVASIAEAEQLIGHLGDAIDSLVAILEEETTLVRAGRLSETARLNATKAELARRYAADAAQVRANSAFISHHVQGKLAELRKRHDRFQGELEVNLTVLATAHAVSEGIIRGVASEMARQAAPQTYAASGRPTTRPVARTSAPISLSRMA